MKKTLEISKQIVKILFPKSRWGNVIYLFLGYGISNYTDLEALIEAIIQLFK